MHQPSDTSLVFAAARSRDAAAISEIVRRYGQLAYSVGRRIAGDEPVAEEIARECVLELASAPHRVRGELASWVHDRAVILAARRVTRTADRNGEAVRSNGHAVRQRDPAEEPHWSDVAHEIDPALANLARKHQHIIIQHYFQRHAQDELAGMLQVAQPTVAKRLRAALEKLRQELIRRGCGCSLAQLMMLLARHAASEAPEELVDRLTHDATKQLAASPPSRGRWLGLLAVWAIIAGMVAAVASSYSSRESQKNPASTNPEQAD